MIRINLLGQERPKPTGRPIPLESTLRVVMLVVAIGLALIVLGVIYHQKSQELAAINAKISNLQAEKVRLQEIKTEVQKFEQDKAVLQQRINVIETLQENRTGGQQLLQMVANTVSRTNALWLTTLDRKGDALVIKGEAGSIDTIASFITQMKRSGYFDKVEIQQAVENDLVKGAQTYEFDMTAEVSQPSPPSAAPPARPTQPRRR